MQGNIVAAGVKEQLEDRGEIKKAIADSAYKGILLFTDAGRIIGEIVEKKAMGGRFRVLQKRWVVERKFAWLGNYRKLSKDYEKTVCMSKAMILITTIVITINKLIA